jgi:hypothetical protein
MNRFVRSTMCQIGLVAGIVAVAVSGCVPELRLRRPR